MPYYEPDTGYYEPSQYDIMIDELKHELKKSVKQEHQDKMEALQKENKELQAVKKRMNEMESEHRRKVAELEQAKSSVVYDVRRERLNELLKSLGHELFRVSSPRNVYGDKCDKCDDDRQISFNSPSGKPLKEDCACKANRYSFFEPKSYLSVEVNLKNHNVWYKPYNVEDGYIVIDNEWSSDSPKFIYSGEPYEEMRKIKYYTHIYFESETAAKDFCDWLNEQKIDKWG